MQLYQRILFSLTQKSLYPFEETARSSHTTLSISMILPTTAPRAALRRVPCRSMKETTAISAYFDGTENWINDETLDQDLNGDLRYLPASVRANLTIWPDYQPQIQMPVTMLPWLASVFASGNESWGYYFIGA